MSGLFFLVPLIVKGTYLKNPFRKRNQFVVQNHHPKNMVWASTQTLVMVFVIDGFKSIHVVGFDYIRKNIFFSKRRIF